MEPAPHGSSIRPSTRIPSALLIAYILILAPIAFWPSPVDSNAGPLLDAITRAAPWLTYERIEFIANVALFVPLGWLLTLILPRSKYLVVPIALGATVLMEGLQAVLLPGRTPSVLDIVANTAGAFIGLLLAVAFRPPGRRRALRSSQ